MFLQHVHNRIRALTVISRHVPLIRDRLAFLRLRRSTVALQRRWRLQLARRVAAASQLQAAVRGWIVRRRTQRALHGIARFQVCSEPEAGACWHFVYGYVSCMLVQVLRIPCVWCLALCFR